jgi:hypothetical protein
MSSHQPVRRLDAMADRQLGLGVDHLARSVPMVAELAQSLVPEDQFLPDDAIHRLDILLIEVSNALGISLDDEGPPL